jgi:hypothetical protein
VIRVIVSDSDFLSADLDCLGEELDHPVEPVERPSPRQGL